MMSTCISAYFEVVSVNADRQTDVHTVFHLISKLILHT